MASLEGKTRVKKREVMAEYDTTQEFLYICKKINSLKKASGFGRLKHAKTDPYILFSGSNQTQPTSKFCNIAIKMHQLMVAYK